VKVSLLQTVQAMMSALPDEQLNKIADVRHWVIPQDETERVLLFVAAATQQWREECQNSQ